MKKFSGAKAIADSLKMIWALDKRIFLYCAATAVADAAIPYIGILLSAFVIDGLAGGGGLSDMAATACAAVAAVFALTVLREYILKTNAVRTENCVQKFDMLKCERTLTMDYQLLESPAINDLRARMRNDRNWGSGFYTMIYDLPALFSQLTGLIIAAALFAPLFMRDTFAGPRAAVMFAFFAAIIACGIINSAYGMKKMQHLMNNTGIRKVFSAFFIWGGGRNYRTGKDIRVYDGAALIRRRVGEDVAANGKFVAGITKVTSLAGLANGICLGLAQGGAYFFILLRAAAGAL